MVGASSLLFQFGKPGQRPGGPALGRTITRRLAGFFGAIADGLTHDLRHLRHLINTHERVHFGHKLRQLIAKALRQAAGNNHRLTAMIRLAQFHRFQNGIHALLLRRINEGTGVDDYRIRLRGIVGDLDAAL